MGDNVYTLKQFSFEKINLNFNMVIIYWLLLVVMLVGVAGAVIPGLPGSSLILTAILVWGFIDGFSGMGFALGIAILVLVLGILIDFLATYWGAKQSGASKWGQIGCLVGFGLGFFGLLPALPFGGPLVGMLIGPFLGAVVGEFLYRKDLEFAQRAKISVKAGIGIVVGTVVGNIIQGILAIATMIVFIVTTWPPN